MFQLLLSGFFLLPDEFPCLSRHKLIIRIDIDPPFLIIDDPFLPGKIMLQDLNILFPDHIRRLVSRHRRRRVHDISLILLAHRGGTQNRLLLTLKASYFLFIVGHGFSSYLGISSPLHPHGFHYGVLIHLSIQNLQQKIRIPVTNGDGISHADIHLLKLCLLLHL